MVVRSEAQHKVSGVHSRSDEGWEPKEGAGPVRLSDGDGHGRGVLFFFPMCSSTITAWNTNGLENPVVWDEEGPILVVARGLQGEAAAR